ncbi:hypothetical protein [Desulfosoma caldarium]|uniref:hypothetical protein n=1 Tax=Desulfosoma caldarium TaxID=610254 RepID=UPI0011CDE888|nr:hypothetical protein [Desulfosoma caldarium]
MTRTTLPASSTTVPPENVVFQNPFCGFFHREIFRNRDKVLIHDALNCDPGQRVEQFMNFEQRRTEG